MLKWLVFAVFNFHYIDLVVLNILIWSQTWIYLWNGLFHLNLLMYIPYLGIKHMNWECYDNIIALNHWLMTYLHYLIMYASLISFSEKICVLMTRHLFLGIQSHAVLSCLDFSKCCSFNCMVCNIAFGLFLLMKLLTILLHFWLLCQLFWIFHLYKQRLLWNLFGVWFHPFGS